MCVCIEVSVVFKIIACEYVCYGCVVRFGGSHSSAGEDLVLGRTSPRRLLQDIRKQPTCDTAHSIVSQMTWIFIPCFYRTPLFYRMMEELKGKRGNYIRNISSFSDL